MPISITEFAAQIRTLILDDHAGNEKGTQDLKNDLNTESNLATSIIGSYEKKEHITRNQEHIIDFKFINMDKSAEYHFKGILSEEGKYSVNFVEKRNKIYFQTIR